MTNIFVRYQLQNMEISPGILKNEWRNPARRINFWAFADEILKEKKADLSLATWRHHKSILKIIKEYRPALSFAEITPAFIDALQRCLKVTHKNDINNIYGKMRVLRAYLNLAVRRGVISENPFSKVKLKTHQLTVFF